MNLIRCLIVGLFIGCEGELAQESLNNVRDVLASIIKRAMPDPCARQFHAF